MSYDLDVDRQMAVSDPHEFADRHNSRLTDETERRLRIATRDANLTAICRVVAKRSLLAAAERTGRLPEVVVRLPHAVPAT